MIDVPRIFQRTVAFPVECTLLERFVLTFDLSVRLRIVGRSSNVGGQFQLYRLFTYQVIRGQNVYSMFTGIYPSQNLRFLPRSMKTKGVFWKIAT
jgi:hypothetical protein